MNEAIKLAIKGGWGGDTTSVQDALTQEFIDFYSEPINFAWATQQASFWQALGKALGWRQCPLRHLNHDVGCQEYIKWRLRYFALIFAGGNTEKFWKELLTSN